MQQLQIGQRIKVADGIEGLAGATGQITGDLLHGSFGVTLDVEFDQYQIPAAFEPGELVLEGSAS